MSLFGDDDAPAQRTAKSTLFDDDAAAATPSKASNSSMFGDDSGDANDSPWGFTPSKKNSAGRGNLVKSLLADVDAPELYIDTFDSLQAGGSVTAEECRRLLAGSRIAPINQDKIWAIVTRNGQVVGLSRLEFSVLLALIGLAQEGEELSLDAVDERRSKLPIPSLPAPAKQEQPLAVPSPQPSSAQSGAQQGSPAKRNGGARKESFGAGFGEADPWGSPAMHRGHAHQNGAPQKTTSAFTTDAAEPSDLPPTESYSNGRPSEGISGGSWDAGHDSTEGFGAPQVPGSGSGEDGNNSSNPRRAAPQRSGTSRGQEEVVTVNMLEEKEGMFLFQHRNYEVASVRRNSKVIRRYSDFVWLLDCLYKRYPFRQLPLLPPKRVAINGNHIAADQTFIEKRRRGLARFANALVRHPVLREEQLVVMFLTVPTELAGWRKQATISVQEEFIGKNLPPALEDSLPQNLFEVFDTVRSGVRRSADLYISLCSLTERLCKRKEALAGEYGRFSLTLTSLTEVSADTYAIDVNDVPLLNEGLKSTAKNISTSQSLIEDESRAWDEGVLEDLKTMRDCLVSVRDMFDRRDRYAKDNIPQLEERIRKNEQKLQGIKQKGDQAKAGEAEKVENAIVADKQSIVNQHARGVVIKECIRDEIVYFNTTQARVSRLHQDWAQERVKYAELQADTFRRMVDEVEGMPLGD